MTDTVLADVGNIANIRDEIFRRVAFNVNNNGLWLSGNSVFIDSSAGDIDYILPPAAEFVGEEIFFKLNQVGSGNIFKLITHAGDTFDNTVGFTFFSLTFKNEYFKIKSNGTNSWLLIDRRTFCGAGLTASAISFAVTGTPTKINVFDAVPATTQTRCEANIANSSIDILDIQSESGDFYDIRFGGSYDYQNNADITIQVYCDGVPIPSLIAKDQGQGPNNFNSFGMAQLLPIKEPCALTLMISGSNSQSTPIDGLVFDVNKIGG